MAETKTYNILISLVIILTMVFLAIIGLIYNIKTVALNEKIQSFKQKTLELQDENHLLYIEILQMNSLAHLEQIAEELKMEKPKKIIYFDCRKK